MKKLGIMINDIVDSQQYITIVKNINAICKKNTDIDPIIFTNRNNSTIADNEFAIMGSVEALDYDGILIATDNISAAILQNCLAAQEKYFYIWNINWFLQNFPVERMKDIYLREDIELIARSEDHNRAISKIFRKPKYIIEEFNYEQIIERIIYS